jgi:hypothetical protein
VLLACCWESLSREFRAELAGAWSFLKGETDVNVFRAERVRSVQHVVRWLGYWRASKLSRQPVLASNVQGGFMMMARAIEAAEDVVLESLQPNQPGVWQVVVVTRGVVVAVVEASEVVVVVVVDLSKHPHQPGVLQFSVRVCVLEVDVDEEVVVEVVIVPLNRQLKQSTHSESSSSHFGTSSYARTTSLMTPSIPWCETLCHQPLSVTVS